MIINKKSWHYWLWRRSFPDRDSCPYYTNFCAYCRRVLWMMFSFLILGMLLIGTAIALLWAIYIVGSTVYRYPVLALAVAGPVLLVIGLILALRRWLRAPKQVKNPGLALQWMAAKKQKICPMVQFEE